MFRREFLRNTIIASTASAMIPWDVFKTNKEFSNITILHTNDMHSRIDPFPMDGGRNQGMGGVVMRAAKIEEIRKEREHVLLLDAGDVFQGTPYFNFFNGEVEVKAMSEMKYDLCTIGNHDFDGGIQNLANQIDKATFQMLSSNYDFSNTPLKGKTKTYKVFEKDGIRIGVYAIGIKLKGLVPDELYGDTVYMDPIKEARKYEQILKVDEKCDYVICLSHVGYKYGSEKVSDLVLASNTSETDLFIGGHTHTFLREPDVVVNSKGNKVLVNQVGYAGIMLGRIDLVFEKNKKGKCTSCQNTWLGKIS
ncbi:bifunctional metallophosphatase/5'-nucleotidase [Portibacter lacus]|uniref:Metallophosphatase n=1 Tax=Portibacter lacus TaxID=1099794 RepID=A0AA37SPB4_9BACT|nr:metallophosphoesterase [Portibacter lacus]GLR17209.1 metallophosphatase [Portibacter lacus]